MDVYYGGWNPRFAYFTHNPWGGACTFNCVQMGDLEATAFTVSGVPSTTTMTTTTTPFDLAANGASAVGSALRTPGLVTQLSGYAPDMRVYVNLLSESGGETGYYNTQPSNPTDNNYGVYLSPSAEDGHDSKWQTIIDHEFGHYVTDLRSGTSDWGFGLPSANPACRCNHILDQGQASHCLQSANGNGFATNEGFAHFFAAQALQPLSHSSCNFGYYKEFLEDDSSVDLPPVTKSCASQVKWGWSYSCTDSNSAVEWDWLGGLWSVRTDPTAPYSMDDFFAVREAACGHPGTRRVYPNDAELSPALIRSGAETLYGSGSPKSVRLNVDFTANGI